MSTELHHHETAGPNTGLLVLLAGLVLSVLLHLGTAVGAGAYLTRSAAVAHHTIQPIAPDALKAPPPQEKDPRRELGRQDAKTASIAWLGVINDPLEGIAEESTVEQAQLSIEQGRDTESAPSVPPQPSNEPIEQQQPAVESSTSPLREPESSDQPIESPPEDPQQAAEQTDPQRSIELPIEPSRSEDAQVPEIVDETTQKPEPQPEPTASTPDPDEQAPLGPDLVSHEPEPEAKPEPEQPEPQAQEQTQSPEVKPSPATTPTSSSDPAKLGKPGLEQDRESTASIIKRAQLVEAKDLNRPIVGKGLEIKPVEPRYPASTRFTQLPRNPIVLIRFNAAGRVAKASFLRDDKRIFDTGSKQVDEPLLNAIYKWRASGKELEALVPGDPQSTIEISMKIIFREDD